jgi:hypothetical protein
MLLKKPMLSLKRIIAMDRRKAAIHEAGHVVLARHLGELGAYARLERTFAPDVACEKQWAGHTEFNLNKLCSRRAKIMIAVAGAVAEYCWKRWDFEEDSWYDPNVMSPTDWALARCILKVRLEH